MKKVFGILLLILLACASCGDGSSESEPSLKVHDEYSKEKKAEKKSDIGRVTYVSWTSKAETKKLCGLTFNIRCRVTINKNDSIKILGYEKEQPYTVTRSLRKYLKTFRIDEKVLKERAVKTGDQAVFLRYAAPK